MGLGVYIESITYFLEIVLPHLRGDVAFTQEKKSNTILTQLFFLQRIFIQAFQYVILVLFIQTFTSKFL